MAKRKPPARKRAEPLADLAMVVAELRSEAKATGLDKLTKREISAEVAADGFLDALNIDDFVGADQVVHLGLGKNCQTDICTTFYSSTGAELWVATEADRSATSFCGIDLCWRIPPAFSTLKGLVNLEGLLRPTLPNC